MILFLNNTLIKEKVLKNKILQLINSSSILLRFTTISQIAHGK